MATIGVPKCVASSTEFIPACVMNNDRRLSPGNSDDLEEKHCDPDVLTDYEQCVVTLDRIGRLHPLSPFALQNSIYRWKIPNYSP